MLATARADEQTMSESTNPSPPEELPPEYLGFFACFNRAEFFEAHEVLEELWLDCRMSAIGNFYKGLIQYAGVFVHLQHGRPAPAAALLRLAHGHLSTYPSPHERLEVEQVCADIRTWLGRVEGGEPIEALLAPDQLPRLGLLPTA